MECEVCYAATANCSLVCGHKFCRDCVKTWYHKGAEQNCPMCRAPIYFKGLWRKREEWACEAYEEKTDGIFGEAWEECLNTGMANIEEFLKYIPKGGRRVMRRYHLEELMDDLTNLEKTHRFLKNEDLDEDDLDYVLKYTDDYFSDHSLNSKNQGREVPRVNHKVHENRVKGSGRRGAYQSRGQIGRR